MTGMFPNLVARPSRERFACKLSEHHSCKVMSSRTALPARPPRPRTAVPASPLSPRHRPSPARGAQSWGAMPAMFRS